MTTDWQVRQAIADQITNAFSTVTDIDRLGIHIEPGTFSIAEMPAIDTLYMPGIMRQFPAAFNQVRGSLQLNIRARVSPADAYAGEELLSAFMDDVGDLSILIALDSDPSLNGLVSQAHCGEWTPVRPFPVPDGGGELIGSTLPLEVVKVHS